MMTDKAVERALLLDVLDLIIWYRIAESIGWRYVA